MKLSSNILLQGALVLATLGPCHVPAWGQIPQAPSSAPMHKGDSEPVGKHLPMPGPRRAFPGLDFADGRKLEYLGMVTTDGKYKALTRLSRFLASREIPTPPDDDTGIVEVDPEAALESTQAEPRVIPDGIKLRSNEQVVPDMQPPNRAVQVDEDFSMLKDMRDALVSFAYGAEPVLQYPKHITTDSAGRIIISDPKARAVHVIDRSGKLSFRIVGGEGHRLQVPSGVAVDAEHNLYVADCKRGTILVYEPDGKFLRSLGEVNGENFFQFPTAIAINQKKKLLYVLDGPRHLLFILDLQGTVRKSIGQHGGSDAPGEFMNPMDLAINDEEVAVLDKGGRRVQVLDADGKFLRQFTTPGSDPRDSRITGVGMDSKGAVYLSYPGIATVAVFTREGALMGSVGAKGARVGEFKSPASIWIDQEDRVYISDTKIRRVQVFQLKTKLLAP